MRCVICFCFRAVDASLSCFKEFDSCAPRHTEILLKAIEQTKEDRCNVVQFAGAPKFG